MIKYPRFLIFVSIVLSVAAGWYGRTVVFSVQWQFFEALRTTASIVLAIMGAWVTILYPKALDQILSSPKGSATSANRHRISALLLPVKAGTVVLIVVLALGPVSLLVKQIPWVMANVALFRGLSFGLLVLLTLTDMVAVILTIWPVEAARSEVESVHGSKVFKDAILSNAQQGKSAPPV